MPHECIGGCGRTTGDDDPNSECPDCRDQRERQEEAAAACDEPCRVCAPTDAEHCEIRRAREQERAEVWWREGR